MFCPYCSHTDTQVKDSRPSEEGISIKRRRFCPSCGGRFSTIERIHIRQLFVVKKNGKKVPFNRDKLYRSLEIALRKRPVDPEKIDITVNEITQFFENKGLSDIQSEEIGLYISQKLSDIDQVAYIRYMSVYHDFDTVNDFEDIFSKIKDNMS